MLLAQVISAMRKTVPESGMLEASANRKMLDGAFDQEVARSLAAKGGLGIAEQIVGQIEREQAADATAAGAARRARAAVVGPTRRRRERDDGAVDRARARCERAGGTCRVYRHGA